MMLLSVLPYAAAEAETVDEPDFVIDPSEGAELSHSEGALEEERLKRIPTDDAQYEAFRAVMAVPQEERWFDPDIPEIGGIVADDNAEGEKAISGGKLYINATNFPDEQFRWYVDQAFGHANSSYFTTSELNNIVSAYPMGYGIKSVKGIEYFPNLEVLNCGYGYDYDAEEYVYNEITTLDVSKNTKLLTLACGYNQLKSLDVSKNTKLETLDCGGNQLTSLDVGKNTNLQWLDCYSNQLQALNVTKNTALEYLECGNNPIGTLDVSKNTKLEYLYCYSNNLLTLDVTKNTALLNLVCQANDLRTLDVSKNTNLKQLWCFRNGLKSLDVSKNAELADLSCYLNRLTTLDVSHNPNLVDFRCFRNHLTSLDVTHNPNIELLSCGNNRITSLDVSKITALDTLFCNNMPLTSLNVTRNTALTNLSCYSDQLTSLNVSKNGNLRELDCSDNHLKALDVSNNPDLAYLECGGNEIVALDLGNNDMIRNAYIINQSRLLNASDLTQSGNNYVFDLHKLGLSDEELEERVWIWDEGDYSASTGKVTFPKANGAVTYAYETQQDEILLVTLALSFTDDAEIVLNDPTYIFYKGTTPYMVYRDGNLEPNFWVEGANGEEVGVAFYTYQFLNNVKPGTATIKVTFKGTGKVITKNFKIYMPATTATTVANVSNGIKIAWRSVQDAKGYVIYRRAWNLASSGWTTFERWNNTTATTWTDTKVYAGTRYQYGVKAYYSDPMDNYNLGLVGPLKTTVRITSRTLKSLTAGSKKFTAVWDASGVFTGYQLQYATNSAFTAGVKTVSITDKKTASQTVSGLTSGTTYYVRVRSYHKFEGMTYYGAWSAVKSCTVK